MLGGPVEIAARAAKRPDYADAPAVPPPKSTRRRSGPAGSTRRPTPRSSSLAPPSPSTVVCSRTMCVELAWADALLKAGVLSPEDARAITGALTEILERGTADPVWVAGPDEDVHSFVERQLVDRIGDPGRRLTPDARGTNRFLWICGCTCAAGLARSSGRFSTCRCPPHAGRQGGHDVDAGLYTCGGHSQCWWRISCSRMPPRYAGTMPDWSGCGGAQRFRSDRVRLRAPIMPSTRPFWRRRSDFRAW